VGRTLLPKRCYHMMIVKDRSGRHLRESTALRLRFGRLGRLRNDYC
jgi:hypothetical protein